ncbi:MAG: hypothetical protein AAB152_07215 [Candidatus Coatesbacteria bacterium]
MDENKGSAGQVFRGLLMLACLAGIAWFGYTGWKSGQGGFWIFAIIVLVVVFAFTLFFFLVRMKVAAAEIAVTPLKVPVGGEVNVVWRQSFRGQVTVNRAVVRLVYKERAVSGSGKSQSTHIHETVVQEIEKPGRDFAPGEDLAVGAQFRIPPTAMHSFDFGSNQLTWRVETRLDLERWPDDSGEVVLEVEPRLQR